MPQLTEEELEYLRGRPRKRATAGLLAFHHERLLIVQPTYRSHWLIPGGAVEENESPAACCIREVREETSLIINLTGLALVDYRRDPGDGRGDSLHFLFRTAELTEAQVESIRLPTHELKDHRFLPPEEAVPLLEPYLASRVRTFLDHDAGMTIFVENGHVVC